MVDLHFYRRALPLWYIDRLVEKCSLGKLKEWYVELFKIQTHMGGGGDCADVESVRHVRDEEKECRTHNKPHLRILLAYYATQQGLMANKGGSSAAAKRKAKTAAAVLTNSKKAKAAAESVIDCSGSEDEQDEECKQPPPTVPEENKVRAAEFRDCAVAL
jgi:hypothetical protein